jgi:hypothetical protein
MSHNVANSPLVVNGIVAFLRDGIAMRVAVRYLFRSGPLRRKQ